MKELLESRFIAIVEKVKEKAEQESKLEDLLAYLCNQLVFSLECPGVWIGLKEISGKVKKLASSGELTSHLDQTEIRWDDTELGQGAVGRAIKSGQAQLLLVNGNERFIPWLPTLKNLNINSVLSIPIICKGNEVVGAFTIYSEDVYELSEARGAVLTAFAVHVSMLIELQRTRELLERYRLLLENTQDIVLLVEPAGRIIEANKAAVNTYKYSREELLSLNIFDLRIDLNQKIRQQMDTAIRTGIIFETVHKKKDGTLFPVEVSSIGEEVNDRKLLISIVRDISKRKNIENEYQSNKKEMADKISYLATHDILTELPNRNVFARLLKDNIDKEQNKEFAVIVLGIDRFKFINDNYGHDVGDILLIKIADRIKRLLNKTDLISRYGGDEFAILIRSRKNPAKIYDIAARIVNRCFQRFIVRGLELYISVSIGIAIHPDQGKDVDSLLRHADMAMYSAKKNGGNKYQVYISEEDTQPFKRFSLLGNLNKALKNNEFLLYYQPQQELSTGKVKGVEALIRWFSPQGIINPADFIPLAEETGLIVPVGGWVIKTACEQNKRWQESEFKDLKMSINVSAKQFYQPGFITTLEGILYNINLDSKLLNIEITESIAMKNFESAAIIIKEMSNLGLSVTIDDFGTGYSSLNYLANLELDYLKIDKSLIKNLHSQGRKSSVVKGIISIAHNLGMKVIAEGVEKQEELDFLKVHKCDMVQGFLIGHPLPEDQLVKHLSISSI